MVRYQDQDLSRLGKQQLKQKWASMQKLLSSRSRLEQIVADILLDFERKPRLADGRGNAMLVCASVYQACKSYEMFSQAGLLASAPSSPVTNPMPADQGRGRRARG